MFYLFILETKNNVGINCTSAYNLVNEYEIILTFLF